MNNKERRVKARMLLLNASKAWFAGDQQSISSPIDMELDSEDLAGEMAGLSWEFLQSVRTIFPCEKRPLEIHI